MVALKDIRPVSNKPVCSEPAVLCPGSAVCLNPIQVCDGKDDCPNGFDEKLCIKICPLKGDFRCKDRRSCVSKSLVCDGRAHCHDGSDEVGCPAVAPAAPQTSSLRCRLGSRPCGDGQQCVLYSHVCDGEPDCGDGSDEEGCGKYSDPPLEPALGSTYEPVTPAVSGEVTGPPEPTPAPCISPAVQCPLSDLCISHTQLCDGQKDCPDGSDEGNCVKRCPNKSKVSVHLEDVVALLLHINILNASSFQCTSSFKTCKDRRSCVSKSLVCDGRAHCHDGSDEVGCPAVAPAAPQTSSLSCRLGSRPCGDGQQCVLYSHVCDGEPDCGDGSDEQDCGNQISQTPVLNIGRSPSPESMSPVAVATETVTAESCPQPSLPCPGSSTCIAATQFCDGKKDCPNGSDEMCVDKCPRKADFRCKDRRSCVSKSLVCDGRAHCHDGSDEVGCPAVAPAAPQTSSPQVSPGLQAVWRRPAVCPLLPRV
ncbi:SCO-spondin [Merluccius polli]|uniref:SCO-spondin n=1 Tax=Merluccius polli TaxID=89951 RepID=A0AA47NQT1_MERPO|nr:SCO-spondin [Merluccius polli]